VLLVQVKFELS